MYTTQDYIFAAVDIGINEVYAESKLDSYLDTRGDEANPFRFAQWLKHEME
jgi:hypothetical protein